MLPVNNFDINKSGNYTFTYTAEDEAGNLATSIRNVIVRDTPPITINSFTIESNNNNSLYVKAGDEISFYLVVNNTIADHTFQIPNTTITSERAAGTELYIDADILNNATESNATFTITVTNINGTTLTVTEDNLTSSNVFIDTIAPRIQLVGHAEYFIVNGTVDPIIPNVTVTDGDPNYSGGFTLSTNDTNDKIDTAIIGSVYNYTYTADADTAGNPGESVSRIITIIEADPITVTSLSIASSSGNNFANAGKTITVTLVTDGTDLGNFTGTLLGRDIVIEDVNRGTATFTTTVMLDDINENVTFSITATNSSGNKILVTNDDITDGSFVTIDTVSPTITLNGKNNTIVALGTSYTDPGATASDTSYANDMQISAKGNVIVNQLGNYTLTYTAPTDAAGNIGQTITRTVTVSDIPPINITALTLNSSNSKNSLYAKHGDTLTITLTINYTITSYTATILDIEQPEAYPSNNTIILTETVPSNLTVEDYATFSITVIDEDGLSNMITQENLTSSNIFVDIQLHLE